MGDRLTRLVSAIYSRGPGNPDPDGAAARIWRLCRNMWIEQGTVVVKPAELPDGLREALTAYAEDQYGVRRHGR